MDVTPDAVPVIDEVKAHAWVFHRHRLFPRHGFVIGPGAGRLMADLVAGDTPVVDPKPFRLDRFARAGKGGAGGGGPPGPPPRKPTDESSCTYTTGTDPLGNVAERCR